MPGQYGECAADTQMEVIDIIQYDIVINIAQSWGYFHLFVETLPKLAPFIYWIKTEFIRNWGHLNLKLNINIPYLETPFNLFRFLFRHELEQKIISIDGRYPKYIKYLINPQATACLWPRSAGSILLNNILRNEVELFAKENNVSIYNNDTKMKNTKYIVLLKRSSKREIKNHDVLKSRIIEKYINSSLRYHLYIHDDGKLNARYPFEYFVEFYRADIVIGAFGAGLVNVAFCKPGTVVIMMQGSHHKDHKMYMAHSMALGMRYYAYYTDTKWKINIDQVMQVLDLYL